jgi:hypothetical protein
MDKRRLIDQFLAFISHMDVDGAITLDLFYGLFGFGVE